MPSERQWQRWLERLYNLRRDKRGHYERPHKPVLLLAIIDLLDRGNIRTNEVRFSPELKGAFCRIFEVVRRPGDQPTIENPFYFLSGDGFWQLIPDGGGAPIYSKGNASSPPAIGVLRTVSGRFDQEFFEAFLKDPLARHQLREGLIARYFPEHREQLAAVFAAPSPHTQEQVLREQPPGRDAAFRHTILELYDFRCAACGIRVKIQDEISLVEAAHLIPFSVSQNDRPDNGLALCPNHHWAMDRFLIAPCPDPKHRAGIWRAGRKLDSRIEGQKELVAIADRPVIAPKEEMFYPALESLRWREKHLSGKY